MGKWLVLVVGFSMAACATTTPQRTPSAENSVAQDDSACRTMIKLAELCYSNSGPGTSCSDLYTAVGSASDGADLRPSERQALATFCGRTCLARKNGATWSSVRRAMSENCD